MIRLVVVASDCAAAANVGGNVATSATTFDIDHPALEAALRQGEKSGGYVSVMLTYELRKAEATC
jgi:hypothetical protein